MGMYAAAAPKMRVAIVEDGGNVVFDGWVAFFGSNLLDATKSSSELMLEIEAIR